MGSFIDLTGKVFGRLTVLGLSHKDDKNKYLWNCKCSCGNNIMVRGDYLRHSHKKSCGCLRDEVPNALKHGFRGTRFYNIWKGIRKRCLNPNSSNYKYYGGKEVSICQRWNDFINFKNDMYKSYQKHVDEHGEDDTTIDRIDVNLGYEPFNCKWATKIEQAENRLCQKYFVAINDSGKTLISRNQSKFARDNYLSEPSINRKLKNKDNTPYKGWIFRYATEEEIEEFLKNKEE